MLPRIATKKLQTPEVDQFISDVRMSNFCGDIEVNEVQLAIASTDNSIWQSTPQAVIAPRSLSCVEEIVSILSQEKHRKISITARGGGTSTAGQSLSNSIVLDCKRHMQHIIDYNHVTKQVHVECGAVLQQVNDELSQHGVMIGPTVATASRATIGGMIGNDSAGKGSQVYGKMSDCVVELETVIKGGEVLLSNATNIDCDRELYSSVKTACDTARPYIKEHWPSLPRCVTGYNLPMAWDGNTFDLNRILCGSEGTLGITTSAKLQCVSLPKNQRLLVLGFVTFDTALRCGAALTQHSPTAIETIDELVMQTLRRDASWSSVSTLFASSKDDIQTVLFVEFCDQNAHKVNDALQDAQSNYHPMFARILKDKAEIQLAWSFRSRSVGLLSSLSGSKKPVPFVEDCAVPPEKLADFIGEFRSLLDAYQLQAGMFGHIDAGVIHVRPALNMRDLHDRKKVHEITSKVAALVHDYGGVLWGEHGKGYRSEFGPKTFPKVIWEQMRIVKTAFDPHNQFNPGKVATPLGVPTLASMNSPTRGEQDERTSHFHILSDATQCDGNGECQSVSIAAMMCPTYRATNNQQDSPRGRADALRYWLSALEKDFDGRQGSFFTKVRNSGNPNDVSHDVRQILDGCLACKACATGCPMQIDISSMRAEFYHAYFTRYFRPLRDIVWLHMERFLPLQSSFIGKLFPSRLFASTIGIVDAPKPTGSLKRQVTTSSPDELASLQPTVVLLQDSFTTFFRPTVFLALIKLLEYLGERVAVLPLKTCGKSLHIRGSLDAFKIVAKCNLDWITKLPLNNATVIGIDPAATLLWRDEYPKALGLNELPIQVVLPQECLIQKDLSSIKLGRNWQLFQHCIEQALAPESGRQWQQLFASMGSKLELIDTACCGMGGMFGHAQEHKELSLAIWDKHWKPHNPTKDSLTTGYSCHSQALRAEQILLQHPLEAIVPFISSSN